MKRTRIISSILIVALMLTMCFSIGVFADDATDQAACSDKALEEHGQQHGTISSIIKLTDKTNSSGDAIYQIWFSDGAVYYYTPIYGEANGTPYTTSSYIEDPYGYTLNQRGIPQIVEDMLGSTVAKVTDVPGLVHCYSATANGTVMYYIFNANSPDVSWGGRGTLTLNNLDYDLAILSNAGLTIDEQSGFPLDNGQPVNPFTGLLMEGGTKCSVYDAVASLLLPNDPHAYSNPVEEEEEEEVVEEEDKKEDKKEDSTSVKSNAELINFYATGTNSYTVTLPTQYSTSVTDDGTSLSGVFSFNLNDVAGDGTYFARLRVIDAENTERYWLDGNSDDKTHYSQQNAAATLTYYEDQYMVNSDAGAKIRYDLYKDEINPRKTVTPTNEPLGLENVVISKQFTTTAADFGPFIESTTLYILLDMEGRENLPHGTYKDILTFQSSIEAYVAPVETPPNEEVPPGLG